MYYVSYGAIPYNEKEKMMENTRVHYEARYEFGGYAHICGNTIEELQKQIDEKFKYPDNMKPENVIYWENQKRGLTFHKVTTVSEQITL